MTELLQRLPKKRPDNRTTGLLAYGGTAWAIYTVVVWIAEYYRIGVIQEMPEQVRLAAVLVVSGGIEWARRELRNYQESR